MVVKVAGYPPKVGWQWADAADATLASRTRSRQSKFEGHYNMTTALLPFLIMGIVALASGIAVLFSLTKVSRFFNRLGRDTFGAQTSKAMFKKNNMALAGAGFILFGLMATCGVFAGWFSG